MENSGISSYRLKRFVKHLCLIAKRHEEHQIAKKNLEMHLKGLGKGKEVQLEELNKKINLLIEKEAKVAEIGLPKNLPPGLSKRIKLLEEQVKFLEQENGKLSKENDALKQDILAFDDNDAYSARIQEKAGEESKKFLIKELQDKILLLESSYKKISKDKSISKLKLKEIQDKISIYKKQLNLVEN